MSERQPVIDKQMGLFSKLWYTIEYRLDVGDWPDAQIVSVTENPEASYSGNTNSITYLLANGRIVSKDKKGTSGLP